MAISKIIDAWSTNYYDHLLEVKNFRLSTKSGDTSGRWVQCPNYIPAFTYASIINEFIFFAFCSYSFLISLFNNNSLRKGSHVQDWPPSDEFLIGWIYHYLLFNISFFGLLLLASRLVFHDIFFHYTNYLQSNYLSLLKVIRVWGNLNSTLCFS